MTQTTDVALSNNPRAVQAQTQAQPRPTIVPAVDIIEDATGITLVADLPGVSKERLNVRVESDHLFVEGEASVPVPEGLKLYHSEIQVPVYRRSFVLGRELDKNKIEASLKDGVLELRIPRVQEAQPRRIEVKTE
ncbi:Hsp20/alpha crystallin family protein [Pigmentiphaga soli]|uniref:Hsp20/alpha crystallin family protein n=1 Tax=Pigmentiphaga soli TaxID=1007095 RepID=A0ABP8GYB9_9BURK